MKVMVSWSGGKDSCLAFYKAMQDGLEVSHLLNMAVDGRSHGLDRSLIGAQSTAMGVPLVQKVVSWDTYEEEFKKALRELKGEGVEGGIFGDIDLQVHRDWVENTCAEVGIKPFLPLWKRERGGLIEEFVSAGFEAVIVCVRADVLDRRWLGRKIDKEFARDISKENVDPCGEGGEYHTLVVDGPTFGKKLEILESAEEQRNGKWFLDVRRYNLNEK